VLGEVLDEMLETLLDEERGLVLALVLEGPAAFFLGTGDGMREEDVRFCETERSGTALGPGGFCRVGDFSLRSRFGEDPMERLEN
jgi:hypothetical protein